MNTLISNHKWNLIFWSIQVLGWVGIISFSFIVTKMSGLYGDMPIPIYTYMTPALAGIVSTSLLRTYFNKKINLKKFDVKQLPRIIAAVAVASTMYFVFSFGAGVLQGYSDAKSGNIEQRDMPKIYNVSSGIAIVMSVFGAFLSIVIWLVLYIAVKLVINYSIDQLERSRLHASLKQAELSTLKGQINPHFMFNSLNNIRGLMLEDVHKSREMITKLSELLRYSLNSHKVDMIPLHKEIEVVHNYLELSKIQLEDRLQYLENIDNSLLDVKIPPMLIQMLIENAIKHGVSNQVGGGEVSLDISIEAQVLGIIVKNTGMLKESTSDTKIGVQNIKERLRLLYGKESLFALRQLGDVVEATVKIPLHEK